MPAYNEAECIDAVVHEWVRLAKKYAARVLVVNDGSTDATPDMLDAIARREPAVMVVHQENLGHGPAVLAGYRRALATGATWIFQVDADRQFFPADFSLIWDYRNTSPFVLGWRKHRGDGHARKLISCTLSWLIFFSFGTSIRDPNVPFRLMRADFLSSLLPLLPNGLFSPNVFLGVLAKKAGANLVEIPVRHKKRETGKFFLLRLRLIPLFIRSARQLLWLRATGFGKSRDAGR